MNAVSARISIILLIFSYVVTVKLLYVAGISFLGNFGKFSFNYLNVKNIQCTIVLIIVV